MELAERDVKKEFLADSVFFSRVRVSCLAGVQEFVKGGVGTAVVGAAG